MTTNDEATTALVTIAEALRNLGIAVDELRQLSVEMTELTEWTKRLGDRVTENTTAIAEVDAQVGMVANVSGQVEQVLTQVRPVLDVMAEGGGPMQLLGAMRQS